jgi:hypothetical protein
MTTRARIVLHAGVPKTGTTSLQYHLYDRAELLAAHGVGCPRRRILAGDVDPLFPALRDLRRGPIEGPAAAAIDAARRRLRDLASEQPCIIVSLETLLGEAFERERFFGAAKRSATALLQVLDGFEVHVVVTLRRQHELLLSNYVQHLRMGGTQHLVAFVSPWLERDLGWHGYLRALAMLAPAGSAVLHWDRLQTGLEPLRAAVLERAGIAALETGPIERRNTSFASGAHGRVRALNTLVARTGLVRSARFERLRRALVEAAGRLGREREIDAPSRAVLEAIRVRYHAENEALAAVSGASLAAMIETASAFDPRRRHRGRRTAQG